MFERLGAFTARRFIWVIVGWLALAAVVQVSAPPLQEVLTYDESAFLNPDAPSLRAGHLLDRAWPGETFGGAAAVVVERRDGRLRGSDLDYVASLERWLRGDAAPDVVDGTASVRSRPEMRSVLLAQDGRATILLVSFSVPPFEPPTTRAVAAIREHIHGTEPAGLQAWVSGEAGVGADQDAAIRESVDRTTVMTLVLIILILLAIYRSPVAPLVPLITIGTALAVSQGVIALLAGAGMKVSSMVETFMVVIIFGAGTDYCLFVISRFREDVTRAREYRKTLVGTMAAVGAVIASSAGTVTVGFLSQASARFGMFRTTGPAMAIAVLITLVAGLTLTPALMRAFGRVLFWPAHPDRVAPAGEEVAAYPDLPPDEPPGARGRRAAQETASLSGRGGEGV